MSFLTSPHRQRLLAIAREAGNRLFDPGTGLCLISRDTLWYACSLLFDSSNEQQRLGRHLIEHAQSEDGTHTPATMCAMLCVPDLRISGDMRTHLRAEVRRELTHAAEVTWHDGNVNHPLGAYASLVLGGEIAGETWAVDLGHRRLLELQRLTGDRRFRGHRQAEMSEYVSPTYTALDLLFLALIAEFCRAPLARSLATFLEQRLWLDIALHFHAPSEQFAGPHSRSYQDDSTGGFSALHTVLYAADAHDLYLNPELCVRYNHPSSLLQCALSAIVPTHMPESARRLLRDKPYPLMMRKITYCEQYHENSYRLVNELPAPLPQQPFPPPRVFAFDDEVYPGGLRELTTYMTGEYALGSASLPYVNGGHSDGFMLRIRRADTVQSMADFRSAFTRGVFNGATLGSRNHCHTTGTTIDESFLYEEGRCAVYQHRNRAIVFYAPKRAGYRGFYSFRAQLIFGYFAPFTRLLFTDDPSAHVLAQREESPLIPVQQVPADGGAATRLYFQDHRTFGVVIPLATVPSANAMPVRLHMESHHLIFSMVNYEGPLRDVERDVLTGWRAGFAVELASLEEFASFGAFVSHAAALRLTESTDDTHARTATFHHAEGTMRAVYDPYREQFLSRTWNGREDREHHLTVQGGPDQSSLLHPLTLFGNEAFEAPA